MAQSNDQPDSEAPGSRSVARTQPAHLAIMAKMHGLQPVDPARARVLQIGCGAGVNLLPLAERYPSSVLLGIDPSEEHIATAQQAVAGLRMANIAFRRQDISELDPELGTFDYIIAEGIYSSLRGTLGDKLLAICRQHLAPQGLAYVSYDTYPGCHVHDLLRCAMLYEARGAHTPADQVARARMLLDFLDTSLTDEKNTYDALVRPEVQRSLKKSDARLRREYLDAAHEPVYFQRFMAHVLGHGLQFVGECTLGFRSCDYLGPDLEQRLGQLTTDPIQKEQYRDIVRNKCFRQSVLCHQEAAVFKSPAPALLRGMYLESHVVAESAGANIQSTEMDRFLASNGLRVSTAVPLIKAALAELGANWPNYVSYERLLEAARDRLDAARPGSAAATRVSRLEESLLECGLSGSIELHGEPQPFTTDVTARPAASPLARWQAQRGAMVTNRKHESVQLDYFDQQILQLLDGARDGSQLVEHLAAAAQAGRLLVLENQQPIQDPQRMRQALSGILPSSLARLARLAFLVG